MVVSKSLKLFINPISVYGVEDILKIHQFLFEDMYHWTGEFRKVNISKSGNAFMLKLIVEKNSFSYWSKF